MQSTHGKTKFTIKGEPIEAHTLVREHKLASFDNISQISSLHLTGLSVGEIVSLFQRRGPHLVIRPNNVTLH